MKAVLISIRPEWCEKIASGQKIIEVRKTRPKLDVPFKCYIYQTRTKWVFSVLRKLGFDDLAVKLQRGFGKVIGEFVCDYITRSDYEYDDDDPLYNPGPRAVYWPQIDLDAACLNYAAVMDYGGKKPLYSWHISDLVVYDEPVGLYEFGKKCESAACEGCEHLKYQRVNSEKYDFDCEFYRQEIPITRAPQSWCYVEEVIGYA